MVALSEILDQLKDTVIGGVENLAIFAASLSTSQSLRHSANLHTETCVVSMIIKHLLN
jgi:hypothetical protein